MSPGDRSEHEDFTRHHHVIRVVAASVVAVLALLVSASVGAELFGSSASGAKRASHATGVTSASECHALVGGLLADLGGAAAGVQEEAATGRLRGADLGRRWDEAERAWQGRWEVVNYRCEFDEAAESGRGAAYDRMAWVHRRLRTLAHDYREAQSRFAERQAPLLAELHEALDRSRALLEPR